MPVQAARPKQRSLANRSVRPRRASKAKRSSGESWHKLVISVQDLIDRIDDPIADILYSLLCDQDRSSQIARDALNRGSAMAALALVPALVGQFALAPATAALVAGVVVKALLTKGPEKLCEELAEARAAKVEPKRRAPAQKKTGARAQAARKKATRAR
ncbi:MAG TPA: hypothetical protein VJG32_18720 [Anaerolineae bacterium]|nr:hypothetical protein [Anaerolineae bacterium]